LDVIVTPRSGGAPAAMTSKLAGVFDAYCDVAFDKVACADELDGRSVVRILDLQTSSRKTVLLPGGASSFAGQSAGFVGSAWERSHVVFASATKIFAQTNDELYMLDGDRVTRLDVTLAQPGHGIVSWRVLPGGLLFSEGAGPEHEFDVDHELAMVKYWPFGPSTR